MRIGADPEEAISEEKNAGGYPGLDLNDQSLVPAMMIPSMDRASTRLLWRKMPAGNPTHSEIRSAMRMRRLIQASSRRSSGDL